MDKGTATRKPSDNRKWASMANFQVGLNAIADEFEVEEYYMKTVDTLLKKTFSLGEKCTVGPNSTS